MPAFERKEKVEKTFFDPCDLSPNLRGDKNKAVKAVLCVCVFITACLTPCLLRAELSSFVFILFWSSDVPRQRVWMKHVLDTFSHEWTTIQVPLGEVAWSIYQKYLQGAG